MVFRYRIDRALRTCVMKVIGLLTHRAADEAVNLRRQAIRKILLVRGIFRLGDAVLAQPAVDLLRLNFPTAEIDFVGPAVGARLFGNVVNRYYAIERQFPLVCWSYFALLRQLRARRYDLAIDISVSSAAMGAALVGFSGARWRAGLRGRWDQWFNVRVERPREVNKYQSLLALVLKLGLTGRRRCYPQITVPRDQLAMARKRLEEEIRGCERTIIGVFVGGRRSRGKRWPKEKFLELAAALRYVDAEVVFFVGPEERSLLGFYESILKWRCVVIYEPDVRAFAALVANCDLFVSGDSGPMHLACALGVRTIALFLKNNMPRWAPPRELAWCVYREPCPSVSDVLEACRSELDAIGAQREHAAG